MIITAKNIDRVLEKPHYIVIPRHSIAATFLLHAAFLNIACVLLYGVWAYVGIPLLLAELLMQQLILRRIWQRVGYSQRVFTAGVILGVIANIFVAIPERRLITELINAVFMR